MHSPRHALLVTSAMVAGLALVASITLATQPWRQQPRVPVLPAFVPPPHPQWPDHYHHFVIEVPHPAVLTSALGGSRPAPHHPATNQQPVAPAGQQSMLQAVAPDQADPVVLRPGQAVSVLLKHLAALPPGTRLERDDLGNVRAVLPRGHHAPVPRDSTARPLRHQPLAPGGQAGSAEVVRALLAVPGIHQASHVWADRYQVATSLTRSQVAHLPGVASVASNNLLAVMSSEPVQATNDPYFDDEYYLFNDGNNGGSVGSTPGASADFAYAWARSRGAGVVVADIDTGVDTTNPDLTSQVLPTSENFTTSPPSSDIQPVGTSGEYWHATAVDGMLAAAAGNGQFGAGAAPEAKILALKCSDDGYLPDSCIYAAGEYAISQHVKVINMSFGEQASSDPVLQALVADAQKAGILVTAAAGNWAVDTDTTSVLPADFATTYDNVISVGATDPNDALANFSDYGPGTVDLMAPGEDVLTDAIDPAVPGGAVSYMDGTSFAAPLVAAAAALLWSADPGLAYQQVKSDILSSAQKVPDLAGKCVTGARLDAQAAVALVSEPVQWSFSGFDQISPDQAASTSVSVSTQPGALPSGVLLGYHLALVYDYQGSMYYVTNLSFEWSMGGSSPQPVTTGPDGSVFIAPPGTNASNYGSSPLHLSFGSSGLPPGYYGLVAYAAQVQSDGSAGPPIGNEQAVFFDVGSAPLPSPTTAPTTNIPPATTSAPATTTPTTSSAPSPTTALVVPTTAPGTTSVVAQITTGTTPTSTTTGNIGPGQATTTAPSTTTTSSKAAPTSAPSTTPTSATATSAAPATTAATSTTTTATTTTGPTTTTTPGSFEITYVSPNQLPLSGGDIQVFGNNLPPNPVVDVGDQGEAVTAATSTEIDVTVGAMSAGAYSVTVYNATKSQSATLSAALTIGPATPSTAAPSTTTSPGVSTSTTSQPPPTTGSGSTTIPTATRTSSTTAVVAPAITALSPSTSSTTVAPTTAAASTTTAPVSSPTTPATTAAPPGGFSPGPGGAPSYDGATLQPVPTSSTLDVVAPGSWPAFSASQIITDNGQAPGSTVMGVDI